MAEGVLGRIVANKAAELGARLAGVTLDALRERAQPTNRSLAATIAQAGARFILEIKKASPSGGAIRADADPATIARGYAGVADALSVLTDADFFGGSLADLAAARANFDGPILAKDFFIDPRQVVEARIAGADAVLVMLSVLVDAEAREIIAEARRLGMDALVEVHDEPELLRALALDAPLIGINNRDLRDLSIDLATTERLAALAPDRILLSESGIATRADLHRLGRHVDGFLIGSTLMRADDPAQASRALIFGRVKLCGLNRPEDIAAAAPATHVGLVLVPGTSRHLALDHAVPLAEAARVRGQRVVGVFRDSAPAEIATAAATLHLDAAQIHGAADLTALRQALPPTCELWRAVAVGSDPLDPATADRLVFDNGPGGTGHTFDWAMIRSHPDLSRALVAGGINPANAREAAAIGAFAIDVGSGVDERPGLKSAEKTRALFDSLRPTARTRTNQCA